MDKCIYEIEEVTPGRNHVHLKSDQSQSSGFLKNYLGQDTIFGCEYFYGEPVLIREVVHVCEDVKRIGDLITTYGFSADVTKKLRDLGTQLVRELDKVGE